MITRCRVQGLKRGRAARRGLWHEIRSPSGTSPQSAQQDAAMTHFFRRLAGHLPRVSLWGFIVFLLFSLQSCADPKPAGPGFVRTEGRHFVRDGKAYYFTGTNFWYGCYLGSPGKSGDRARLERELDALKANGIDNLRVLASSQQSPLNTSLDPAISPSPESTNDSLLIGLDVLLAEMAERDMTAVVFLNNFWEWSGGMSVITGWYDGGQFEKRFGNPADFNWDGFMNYSATFYRNEAANAWWHGELTRIINRKNTVTGRLYREDPVIMAWQLANEPRPGQGAEGLQQVEAYYRWIDSSAAFIKSLDPNHLVTTGSEGAAGSLDSDEIYKKAHGSRNIDYLTFHLWAKNWGWYKAGAAAETFPATVEKAVDYVNRQMKVARELNKPVTMEEFGLGRDLESCEPGSPVTYRDQYFTALFALVADSAAAGGAVAGTNFWAWGGEAKARHADAKWRPGDPFTGDPPQEPQGLNSVFLTDSTTLAIIRDHAARMAALRK